LIANDDVSREKSDAINIKYDIEYKNGSDYVHFKPRLVVLPKQAASIKFKSDAGHVYEIHVLADKE
jgi:hypothetical protein